MNPLIICRTNKTYFMTDIVKNLYQSGHISKPYAFVPYYDQWRQYIEKCEEPTYEKVFGTREIFRNINDEPVDTAELERIEKEYGHHGLWGKIITERWLVSLSARPLYAKIPYYSKEQKLQYFIGLIQLAENIFENHDVDCVMDFAHIGLFRIVLDIVAQKYNIPYYHIANATLRDLESGDRYFVRDRLNDDYAFLKEDHQRYYQNPELVKEGHKYLEMARSDEFKSIYIVGLANEHKKKKTSLIHKTKKTLRQIFKSAARSVLNVAMDIKRAINASRHPEIRYNFALYKADTISTFTRSILGFIRKNYKRHFCNTITEPPKFKYAFITLHYQPESSTSLMSPYEHNQQAVIENIAKSLPLDVQLVVKLNRVMDDRDPISFIRQIDSLPNVHLADPYANTKDFIVNSHCVLTITGTSGLEAALLGKKVILLGDKKIPWHRLKSVVSIKKWQDIHDEIANADEHKTDEKDILAYLQTVHDNSIKLEKNHAWEEEHDTNSPEYQEMIQTISDEIIRRANKTLYKKQVQAA